MPTRRRLPGGGATSSPTEAASVVVALAAEGCHGGHAGAGPLRHGPAGRAPGGDAVGVRAPVPADRRAMPTDRRVGLRSLGPALGVVLPRLAAAVGRHVEQAEGPVDRLVPPAGRGVGEEHAVALAQETDDVPHFSADRRLHAPHRVPGLGVTHELDVWSHLVPRARGQDGERDAAGVEVDGVLHVPGRGGAALALPLVRRAVVPHVLVDDELVATLEQVEKRDRAVNAGDLDRAVELDHWQPPPGRGDRVALTGVRLLADQQHLARRLPGGQVDDWRLAAEVAARVAGRAHGALRCLVPCSSPKFSGCWSIGREDDAGGGWSAVHQLQPVEGAIVCEEAHAPSQKKRVNRQAVLVDEVMRQQRVDQHRAAHDQELTLALMFELRNGSGDVAVQQSGVRPLEPRRCAARCDVLRRRIQCVLERSPRAIPVTQHSLIAAAAEEHPTSSPRTYGPDPLRHDEVPAGDGPAAMGEPVAGVFVLTCWALDYAVEAHVVQHYDLHQCKDSQGVLRASDSSQRTALFTSAVIFASSVAVNFVRAYAFGHIAPSSSFALSLKPSVWYLTLNFPAFWKKQTTLPSLAYAGIPYQVLGTSVGAAALIRECTFLAMARSGPCIFAIAASTSVSPSALAACALRSRAYSRIAAFSSSVNPLALPFALVRLAACLVALVAAFVGAMFRAS